jgi:hypothetical protein
MLKRALIIGLGLVLVIFALAIIFGGPGTPHPMGSITDPFNSVDFSDLPQLSRFTARDGTQLAYRSYAPATSAPSQGSVVLIHGSSATSSSMHPMAKEIERGRIYDLCAGYPWPWWFRRQGPDRLYRTIGRRSH